MRWDMFKVIVERPRRGGHYSPPRGRADQAARQDPELFPRFEPVSRGRGNKGLNENLSPLRRYLLRQVGRPWDLVHAEISAHLRLTSAVQRHVFEHLDEMVVKYVVMDDRRPLWRRDLRPVLASHWRYLCYVCPRTGLLRASPTREKPRAIAQRDRVVLDEGAQLQRIAGVWYHLTMLPIPHLPQDRREAFDVVLHARLDAPDPWTLMKRLEHQHGARGIYAANKLQAGKRTLARLLPEGLR
jgi:hypothetical protein